MDKTWFYLWNMGEEGGKQVKDKMGLLAIKHEGSNFKGEKEKIVINWGSSKVKNKEVYKCTIINNPANVYHSVDKRRFFYNVGKAARTVPWTTNKKAAQQWQEEGYNIYCRTQVKGREGKGIVIVEDGKIPEAKLYTKAIESIAEYRVHVVNGGVIAIHKKVCDNPKPDHAIRNTANGWRFKWVVAYDNDIASQATKCVEALGLDFAAVDVLWDGKKAWVLETNTSPGIDGMNRTVERYAEALTKLVEEKRKKNKRDKNFIRGWFDKWN